MKQKTISRLIVFISLSLLLFSCSAEGSSNNSSREQSEADSGSSTPDDINLSTPDVVVEDGSDQPQGSSDITFEED